MRLLLTAVLAALAGALGIWGLRTSYRYFSAIPWETLVRPPEARKPMAPMALPGRPAAPRFDHFGGDAMLRPPQGELAAPAEAPARGGAPRSPRATAAKAPEPVSRGGRIPKGGRRSVRNLLQMLQGEAGTAGAAAAPGRTGSASSPPVPSSPSEETQAQEETGTQEAPPAAAAPARPVRERTRRAVGAAGSVVPESPPQEEPPAEGGGD